MPPRTILLVLLTLAVPAADSSAQEVVPGTVVRIQQWDSGALIGRVQQLSADSLWLRNVPAGAVWPVPFSSIAVLEVRQPASRGRNAWRWAKRGFAIGAVAGALVCLIDQHNCTAETPTGNLGEAMLGATLFFGAAGAAYGAAGGALFPGHRWVPTAQLGRVKSPAEPCGT
jgi:hypothetical protein